MDALQWSGAHLCVVVVAVSVVAVAAAVVERGRVAGGGGGQVAAKDEGTIAGPAKLRRRKGRQEDDNFDLQGGIRRQAEFGCWGGLAEGQRSGSDRVCNRGRDEATLYPTPVQVGHT